MEFYFILLEGRIQKSNDIPPLPHPNPQPSNHRDHLPGEGGSCPESLDYFLLLNGSFRTEWVLVSMATSRQQQKGSGFRSFLSRPSKLLPGNLSIANLRAREIPTRDLRDTCKWVQLPGRAHSGDDPGPSN